MKRLMTAALLAATALNGAAQAQGGAEIVAREDVTYIPLNPLRGPQGPQAGMLWGDIREDVPSGFLVKFVDGFSSPPHIHNITYRAVVISGEVHNDDPDAEPMWMGPGSAWTQPAGESHITAARGDDVTVFLEITDGPYLVKPAPEEFDNGERPVNLEARNLVGLDSSISGWIAGDDSGAQIAHLWDDPKPGDRRLMVKPRPRGFWDRRGLIPRRPERTSTVARSGRCTKAWQDRHR